MSDTPEQHFDLSPPQDAIVENFGYEYMKDFFPDLKINYEPQDTGPTLPEKYLQYFQETSQAIEENPVKPEKISLFSKTMTKSLSTLKTDPSPQGINTISENTPKEVSTDCCSALKNCKPTFVICNSINLFGNMNWFGLIPLLFSILMLIITICVWKMNHFYYGPFETKGGVPLFKSAIQNVFYAFFWISLIYSSLFYCFLDFYSPTFLTTIFLYVSICGISLFELISICVSPVSKEGEPRFVILLFELAFAIMFFYSTDILIRKRSLFHKLFNRLIYEIGSFFSYFMFVSIATRLSSYSSIMFAEFPWDCLSTYLILFVSMMFLYIMVISNLSIGMCAAHLLGYIVYSNVSVNRNYFSKDAFILFYLIHSLALMLMITSLLTHKTIRRGIVRRDIGLLLLIGELCSLSTFCGPMFMDGITLRPDRALMNFNDVVLFTNLSAGLGFGYYLSITVCLVILGLFIWLFFCIVEDWQDDCNYPWWTCIMYLSLVGSMIALHFNYLMMMRKMCDEGLNSMIITFFAMALSHFINAFMGLCYLFASSAMMINFLYVFIRLSTMFYFVYFGACHIVQYFSYLMDTTIIAYFLTGLFYKNLRSIYDFYNDIFSAILELYDESHTSLGINWFKCFLFFSLFSEICYHVIFSIIPIIGAAIFGIVMLIIFCICD